MNRILISSLTLALLTGAAFAQAAPPPVPPPAVRGMKAPPPPPGGPDAMMDDPGAPPPPPPGGPGGRRSPPPPPSKAAHFRLESGDVALDVKCADDEPMKACGDLTLQLLDKLQARQNASAPRP